MRLLSRTPIATGEAIASGADLGDHLRLSPVEQAASWRYAEVAALELEAYADLALLDQTIVAISQAHETTILHLPVGPADTDPTSVELIEADGSATTLSAAAWTFEPGLHPRVYLIEDMMQPVRITYVAGYGDTASAVPQDLQHAIMDQALRLYDMRGDMEASSIPAPAFSRICARYRRVGVGR